MANEKTLTFTLPNGIKMTKTRVRKNASGKFLYEKKDQFSNESSWVIIAKERSPKTWEILNKKWGV